MRRAIRELRWVIAGALCCVVGTACGGGVTDPFAAVAVSFTAPAEIVLDDTVTFVLEVTNPTQATVTLPTARDFVPFDVLVEDGAGTLVWRAAIGPTIWGDFPVSVGPSSTATLTLRWTLRDLGGNPVAPGSYRVTGILRDESGGAAITTPPADLRVLER